MGTVTAGQRVLVVDDDPELRQMLRDGLGQRGFEVHLARDGVQALHLAKATPPAAVLMDLVMPKHDGEAMVNALRLLYPDLPFILMTGSHQLTAVSDRVRPAAVLTKPFTLSQAAEAIHRVLAAELRPEPAPVDAEDAAGRAPDPQAGWDPAAVDPA